MSRLLNRRSPPNRLCLPVAMTFALGLVACASDDAQTRDDGPGASTDDPGTSAPRGPFDAFDGAPSPADRLSVRPIAVRRVPGLEEGAFDDEGTKVLADAIRRATGALVIDEKSARDAFEKCENLDDNCTSPLMNDFVNATWVVSARVDALGAAHFAAGQVWEGSNVARRSNLQASTRHHAIAKVGWEIGHFLRPKLELEAAAAEQAEVEASEGGEG